MVTEARETGSLIGSDKVEGTAVYGANDTKIGSIERVMIDKLSGKVSYAVLLRRCRLTRQEVNASEKARLQRAFSFKEPLRAVVLQGFRS
jgi:hypothetical protein